MEETLIVTKRTEIRVRISPTIAAERDRLFAGGFCVACGKKPKNGVRRRGQCDACYQNSERAIKNGTVTDAELFRLGKRLKPGKGGRPTTNEFTKFLSGKA